MPNQQETQKGLTYPFGMGWAPDFGHVFKVAESVYWLGMPLPMSLERINLWLLEDGDGWTIVDTGLNLPASVEVWETVISKYLQGRKVKRVIVTHMHPDHIGLAGWLTQKFGCELWTSREEYLMCRNLAADTGKPAPQVAVDFYRAAGMTQNELDDYQSKFGNFGRMLSELPDSYRRLQDRETLSIDNRYWQVIMGNGHSPEHICLYCPALKLLISGDQVIPRISSNVSVWPTEPHDDPLSDWLHSCNKLVKLLPTDLLVLPAHQEPFFGLHTRLNQLIDGHTKALQRLFEHLSEPRTVIETFPVLFRGDIDSEIKIMAIGEALAHLNYLLHRQMIVKTRDENGTDYYQQLPSMALVENPVFGMV